jgi:benzoylformate decarboxylase
MFCIGADLIKMSVYSPVEPLPPHLAVVHLSERARELGKNYPVDIAVQSNVKHALAALIPVLRRRRSAQAAEAAAQRLREIEPRNWSAQRRHAAAAAMRHAESAPIHPHYLMLRICETLPADAVVVEEALISTLSLPTFLPLRDPQRLYGLASGGLGFGVPGAVGVSLALPGRPVAAIIGDGSSMYGVQALWTAAHLKLPITYVICNNRSYRIIKERLVAMQGSDRFVGMDLREPEIDFVHLAQSFGLAARRVSVPDDIVPVLKAAFASGEPNLVDIRVADGFGG